ncbi:MAG TPA: alpha/beta fold hydrolase [Chloroflexia bacterium]|nr:alpha/beta fold hydrolase [Chloroflexia bacterium]
MTLIRTKKRILAKLITIIALLLVAAYLAVSGYIASRIVHPVRKPLTTNPSLYGLKYEAVEFKSAGDDIPLKGWRMELPDGQAKHTILILHGSNSTKDNFISMEVARALVQNGYDVFSFDFRGHGESGGELTSLGSWETRDVAGALAYLKAQSVTEVGVIGYSMGAVTALLAAPDHPEMRAIVSDSAFARLMTIVEQEGMRTNPLAPLFNPGVILMSKLMYGLDLLQNEPKRAISQLRDRPLLLIHSTGDNLIPVSEAYELQRAGASNPNLELWVAQGKGHVSALADNKDEYQERVLGFFDKWLATNR